MEDGDTTVNGVCNHLSTLSLTSQLTNQTRDYSQDEKDPRKIARKYQTDLCKKAMEENVIVYMGTGCGKTHIAILLIYEMRHLIKKPQKSICIFLAPTVALVQQQAKVIENSLDFKVGIYCGNATHLKGHHDWEKEIEEYEVFAMTPQILLHYLSHCFIKIELIALLIFDECHYAQLDSCHPYAEIMKIFYNTDMIKLPRIFGMTASPKLGKAGSIDGLESLLRAKVYMVNDKEELEQYVTNPDVTVYYYDSSKDGYSLQQNVYIRKLEEIKHQCISSFRLSALDQSSLTSAKKLLQKMHCNLEFCVENLGLWGTVQASYIMLKGDHYETNMVEPKESSGDDSLGNKYLHEAAAVLGSVCSKGGTPPDLSSREVLNEPCFSRKLLRLIDVLSNARSRPNMKCIIFVNRIVTARSLSFILRQLKFLSFWKCGFLVGVHSGLVSRKSTSAILEKFRSDELNLLVATKVGEEGLDIQTCCLVIRFDLPETVTSFIQSRGRARMHQSEYVFLVDRSKPGEIESIEAFQKDENQMNEEISCRTPHVAVTDFNLRTYKVDSTGATISSMSSISLLHRYCSKLPHDEYFNPMPQFNFIDGEDGTGKVCYLKLPANAPVHEIISEPQLSIEDAKRDACLKACKALHEIGALTDYLLPEQDDYNEESPQDLSDSESCDDDDARAELHEILVPAALRAPWTFIGTSTCFSSYYINISPNPADRIYRRFGLYVKYPLPEKAAKMKLDLSLARGRMVGTELVPSGLAIFDKDQIEAAEKFQRMFLKMILDRHEFVPEYVSLEDNGVNKSCTLTFYLLLPVIQHDGAKMSVDWTLIRRCLSSPIFGELGIKPVNELSEGKIQLHLANGRKSIDDIVNSLVYVPCKSTFFFISDILQETNGYSPYDDSESHLEHYIEKFDLHLVYPDQPLLKAKQLFVMDNLLRKKNQSGEWREKEEHFIELPPEICQLKIIGFSKDIGSSLSLLPSIMHRLESTLVAIELKEKLVASFTEGAEVTADRILEALTTERCSEHFSLERLEVLGDAFLKFAVGRHVFLKYAALDEGQLTRKRSNIVNNSNLLKVATRHNLQVYIRDESFEADQFFAFGRPCPVSCDKENEKILHPLRNHMKHGPNVKVQCNKCHHWLHKKTISDVVEALVGAFIVDSGFKAATAFLSWLGVPVEFTHTQINTICSESKMFLPLADQTNVNAIEKMLDYTFVHKGLLIQAFIHPSYNNLLGGCYQRLEFLGDAVLDYLITCYLYSVYPNLKPGHLTDLRSLAVNNNSFADVAGRRSFHNFVICDSTPLRDAMNKYVSNIGSSEPSKGQFEEKRCPKVLGDLVESCIGALFLDTGFDLNHTWKIMLSLLDPIISYSKLQFNPLRELQELCQFHNWEVKFSKSKKDGKFLCEVKVEGKRVSATASATHVSGKAAKRMASRQVFESLQAQGHKSKSKSLEEVLRKSERKEAKLIGYDEVPTHENAKPHLTSVQKVSQSICDDKVYYVNKTSERRSTIKYDKVARPPIGQPPFPHEVSPKVSESNCDDKVYSVNNTSHKTSSVNYDKVARPIGQPPSPHEVSEHHSMLSIHGNGSSTNSPAISRNSPHSADTQGSGSPCSVSAKSRLYEVCIANCWKPPLFECCKETGPSHLKEFIIKVVLQIEELQDETFEFYGEPRLRKKDAAENAAEGALWYLNHEGYVWDQKRR